MHGAAAEQQRLGGRLLPDEIVFKITADEQPSAVTWISPPSISGDIAEAAGAIEGRRHTDSESVSTFFGRFLLSEQRTAGLQC